MGIFSRLSGIINANIHAALVALCPFAFGISLSLASPGVSAATDANIYHSYVSECQAKRICNGVYLIARDGSIIFSGAFGDSGDDARRPLTIDSAFDIGSISKQFTAMAVLRQVAAGKVLLDGKVTDYLPDFPYPDITVAQLLSHTSGIADAMPYYSGLIRQGGSKLPITGADVISVLANNMPVAAPAGTRYEYSNTGYMVLAVLVEKVAGEAFHEHLEKLFFKPLGMKNTRLLTPGAESAIRFRAFGFADTPGGERRAIDQIPGFYMRGAGGIYSTAPDLFRWVSALHSYRVVPRQLVMLATTPSRLSDGTSVPYGFGLSLKPDALGNRRVSHGGHWRAFKSNLSWYPDTKVAVIQLTNNGEDDSVDNNLNP